MAPKPKIKYGEIIIILIGLILTIIILVSISNLISSTCGNLSSPRFIPEGFKTNPSPPTTADNVSDILDLINKNMGETSTNIDKINEIIESFDSDICSITTQIDATIESNYVAESSMNDKDLPEEVQQRRKNERGAKSKKYLSTIKNNFVKYNKDIPLIECFNGGDALLEADALQDLNFRINDTKEELQILADTFNNIYKNSISKKICTYFVTLLYNHKYIKKNIKLNNSIQEAFTDVQEIVLDLSKLSPKKIDEILNKCKSPTGFSDENFKEIPKIDFNEEELEKQMNSNKFKIIMEIKGAKDEKEKKIKDLKIEFMKIDKLYEIVNMIKQQTFAIYNFMLIYKNTINLQQKNLRESTAILKDGNLQQQHMNAKFARMKKDESNTKI